MKKNLLKSLLIFSALALAAGCSNDKDNGPTKKPGKMTELFSFEAATNTLLVVDEAGAPVAAEILIGKALNEPFPNNLLQTDAGGQAVAPAAWVDAQPVTVRSPGFIAVTYLMQTPQSIAFSLKKAPQAQKTVLKGTTSGYKIVDGDNWVDFGLIMKGMTKSEILAFDINKVISAESDTISMVGQEVKIPSNVSLPKQRENYFLPITIDKNSYHITLDQQGPTKILALRGRFPFKETVDEMRNDKNFINLINKFSIDGGTLQSLTVSGAQQTLNLNMADLNFKSDVTVTAPAVGKDKIVLTVVAQDMNGILMPTDIKKLGSGQSMKLKSLDPKSAYVLKVLKNANEVNSEAHPNADRLSLTYTPVGVTLPADFLDLIQNPVVQGQTILLDAPKALPGVNSYATYMVLSEVQTVTKGPQTETTALRRWEIYAPGWIRQIDLPQRPVSATASPQWRWEVSYMGGVETINNLGPDMIQKTTHVTRSSTDF